MKEILEKLEARIKELKDSLEKNSWDYCDDDEQPDFDQRLKDHSEMDGINFAIKIIKENDKSGN